MFLGFKILKKFLFIFVIVFLYGCGNLDALLSDTNNYDYDLTMERLAKSFGTKAYIPIGGCSLVNQPNSFGNVYRVCKKSVSNVSCENIEKQTSYRLCISILPGEFEIQSL